MQARIWSVEGVSSFVHAAVGPTCHSQVIPEQHAPCCCDEAGHDDLESNAALVVTSPWPQHQLQYEQAQGQRMAQDSRRRAQEFRLSHMLREARCAMPTWVQGGCAACIVVVRYGSLLHAGHLIFVGRRTCYWLPV